MSQTTPEGVSIEPRNIHFGVEDELKTLWLDGDVFKTCFMNALSMQFPEGERHFIRAVRDYREKIDDPQLLAEIKGFVGQEGVHSREHKHYNEALRARGYDVDGMDARFEKHMNWVRNLSRSRRLAGTVGAEHYTAVLAHKLLAHPEWLRGASPRMRALWRWHAVEEIEHKAVAFDVYQRCVGSEQLRRIVFLFVTFHFFKFTFLNTCSMLKTEGKLWSPGTWLHGMNFLWGKPGVLRACLPDFMRFLRRGFHPWQQDDRGLVEQWKREYAETASS